MPLTQGSCRVRCRSDRRPPQGTRGPRCRKQIVLHIVLNAELHRYVLAARLFDAQAPIYSDKLPELLDVRLMAMSPLAFTLTGFERVAGVDTRSRGLFRTSVAPSRVG